MTTTGSQTAAEPAKEQSVDKDNLLLLVLLLIVLCIMGYFVIGAFPSLNPFDRSEARAREAIEVAVDACGTNQFVFAEKLVAAKTAIRHVPGAKAMELEVVLSNRLKESGCSE